MSERQKRGCVAVLTAEATWVVVIALDVFVFTHLTQWVWEHTVSPWLSVPRLTFVEALIITLLTSVMSFMLVERVRKEIAEDRAA